MYVIRTLPLKVQTYPYKGQNDQFSQLRVTTYVMIDQAECELWRTAVLSFASDEPSLAAIEGGLKAQLTLKSATG